MIYLIFLASIIISSDNILSDASILHKNDCFEFSNIEFPQLPNKFLLKKFIGMASGSKVAAWRYSWNSESITSTIMYNQKFTHQESHLNVVGESENALYLTDCRNNKCIILAEDFKYRFEIDPYFTAIEARSSGSQRDYFWVLTKQHLTRCVVDFALNSHKQIEQFELSPEISKKVTPSLMRFKLWDNAFLMEFILGSPIIYESTAKMATTIPLPNIHQISYSDLVLSPQNKYVLARKFLLDDSFALAVFNNGNYDQPIVSFSNQHEVFRGQKFLPGQDDLFIAGMWGFARSGACLYSISQKAKLIRIYTDDSIEILYWADNNTLNLKTDSLFGLYTLNIANLMAAYSALNPNGHRKILKIGKRKAKEVRKEIDNRVVLSGGGW